MSSDTPTNAEAPNTIAVTIRPIIEGEKYDIEAERNIFHYLCQSRGSLNEFHEVTDNILYLKQTFEDVHTKLKLLDEKKFLSYKKPNRPFFAPSWAPIYQSYVDFLASLRESATTGMTHAQSYLHVVVPILANPDIPFSDKVLELNYFIEKAGNAQGISNAFPDQLNAIYKSIEDVSRRLSEFAKDVNEAVKKEVVERQKQIEMLKKRVKILEAKCQDLLPHLGPAEILSSLGLGGAAFTLLEVLSSPLALAGISVYQILKATSALSEMFTVQNEIHYQNSLMNVLLAEQAQASATDQSVILSLDQMADLIPRLFGILNTASIVINDAKAILEFIKPFEGDPAKLGDIIKERLPFLSVTYNILYDMLKILSWKITPRQAMDGGNSVTGRRPHYHHKPDPHQGGNPSEIEKPIHHGGHKRDDDDERDKFNEKLPQEFPDDDPEKMDVLRVALGRLIDMILYLSNDVRQDHQNGLPVHGDLLIWADTIWGLANALPGQGGILNLTIYQMGDFVRDVMRATWHAHNRVPRENDPMEVLITISTSIQDFVDLLLDLFRPPPVEK
ncbi:hypothetical protein CVT24_008048 [Panaeolus cyanescens]|uniref:Uncharacterized protein n=1 Tax=Panaeolus cyanescens TaxID=181874 RepID=A0A409YQR9_9AGAR|nr:hypothetical protein CVT24_008048 [Panaeolus cyanescens]